MDSRQRKNGDDNHTKKFANNMIQIGHHTVIAIIKLFDLNDSIACEQAIIFAKNEVKTRLAMRKFPDVLQSLQTSVAIYWVN